MYVSVVPPSYTEPVAFDNNTMAPSLSYTDSGKSDTGYTMPVPLYAPSLLDAVCRSEYAPTASTSKSSTAVTVTV